MHKEVNRERVQSNYQIQKKTNKNKNMKFADVIMGDL